MKTKNAAGLTAASHNELHSKAYRKADSRSSTKTKLLVEIRGLVGSLLSPFSPLEEKATAEALFRSTVRKLDVLQNGSCSGPECAGATNATQRVPG
ncbi:MAG: hypothetical protein ACYSW7_05285, partial [Planctomycetota bacterium]